MDIDNNHANQISDVLEEASDVYVGNMVYSGTTDTRLQVREVASMHGIPEDLPIADALAEVKATNKKVKRNPPILSTTPHRPSLTNTEIALIHATYYTVPHAIISHTLGISSALLKVVYQKTKHHILPSIPLVMITDTSRYWTEEEERKVYSYDELNHPDDPLTIKELRRQFVKEQAELDNNLLRGYLESKIEDRNKWTLLGTTGRYCKVSENFDEESLGIYGELKHEITDCLKPSINSYQVETSGYLDTGLNYHTYPYKTLLNIKPVTVYVHHTAYLASYGYHTAYLPTLLANTLLSYKREEDTADIVSLYVLPILLSISPENAIMRSYLHPMNNINVTLSEDLPTGNQYQITYTSNVNDAYFYKHRYYKENKLHIMNVGYQVIRPVVSTRAHASPFKDSNGVLRYRLINPTPLKIPKSKTKRTDIKLAIICEECRTLVSVDTVLSCPHVILRTYNSTASLTKQQAPRAERIRTTTKYDYVYRPEDVHKTIYQIYMEPDTDYSLHYYEKLPRVRKEESLLSYITTVSRNIKPLYTNFNIPIDRTLQEPTIELNVASPDKTT